MTRRFRRPTAFLAFTLLACVVAASPARADLGAFDPSQALPAPIQLPLLSAVDDAAIRCTPEQWQRLVERHREHLVEW